MKDPGSDPERVTLMADPSLEVQIVTASSPEHPIPNSGSQPSVDELFRGAEPVRSADDLARTGVFDDGEVEEFLADLYAMRRADTA
jgi:hypothetical protein